MYDCTNHTMLIICEVNHMQRKTNVAQTSSHRGDKQVDNSYQKQKQEAFRPRPPRLASSQRHVATKMNKVEESKVRIQCGVFHSSFINSAGERRPTLSSSSLSTLDPVMVSGSVWMIIIMLRFYYSCHFSVFLNFSSWAFCWATSPKKEWESEPLWSWRREALYFPDKQSSKRKTEGVKCLIWDLVYLRMSFWVNLKKLGLESETNHLHFNTFLWWMFLLLENRTNTKKV